MEAYMNTLLVLHIMVGFISLVTGVLALAVKKGEKIHRKSGKTFFYSMLAVALTAIGIAIPKRETFLLTIAIFSFFQSYFGYRAIAKQSKQGSFIEWLVLSIAIINSLFMLYTMDIVLVVFGILSVRLIIAQIKLAIKLRKGEIIPYKTWLRQHIAMMMGSFIGTVTAFVVVNVKTTTLGWEWLPWLLPTVILLPMLKYYQFKYAPN